MNVPVSADRLVRVQALWVCLCITPIGFATKFYEGPGRVWVANSLGGVFYEIFWILVILLILPRVNAFRVSATVFTATSLLEFLQLWKPPFLEAVRAHFLGRTLIGNKFTVSDFPYYAAGSLAGALLVRWIQRRSAAVSSRDSGHF